MPKKQAISPSHKPLIGLPLSPGLIVDNLVFVSGQGPLNHETGKFENLDIEHQTCLTLRNVQQILAEAGCSLSDVVKVSVHLQNINDFSKFNAIYQEFFTNPYPTRTTVQSVLGAGISIEIDAIAVRGCGLSERELP